MRNGLRTASISVVLAVTSVLAVTGSNRDAAAGGPYAYDDLADFKWVEISGTGANLTQASTIDDGFTSNVPIGFSFEFLGDAFTQVQVTSNGVISLAQENNAEEENEALPTGHWQEPALFSWWDDLNPPFGDGVFAETLGSPPNRVFLVQWARLPFFGTSDTALEINFEAALCEGSGNIVFQYDDAVFGDPLEPQYDNGGSATVGIQDASSKFALEYSSFEQSIIDGMAIVFYPSGGSPDNCVQALNAVAPTPTAVPPTPTVPAPEVPERGELTLDAEAETVVAGGDTDVTATVVDENGDPVAGEECTFEIKSQPGDGASVDEGPVTTDAEGTATTTLHAGDTPSTVEVEATCGALSQVLEVTVTAIALPETGVAGPSGGIVSPWLALALGALAGLGAAGALTLAARRR